MASKLLTTCLRAGTLHRAGFLRTLSVSANQLTPKIREPAPSFKATAVVNNDFKEIRLEDYRGKYLVLFFYPLDFTFVCPTELIAFSERCVSFARTCQDHHQWQK